jgi:hypothetical protein
VIVASLKTLSAPTGRRFPREVIAVAVRWNLRYALSYRDVEELLAERGIEVETNGGPGPKHGPFESTRQPGYPMPDRSERQAT